MKNKNIFYTLIFAITTFTQISLTQNNSIKWSAFSSGYTNSSSSITFAKSLVGQQFVGASAQANTKIESGFLVDTLLRSVITVVGETKQLPTTFQLYQNYPNPFNPTTVIHYELPVDAKVTLKIYNLLGQIIETLVDDIQPAGFKSINWDGISYANGVYFYTIEATNIADYSKSFKQFKKMILLK